MKKILFTILAALCLAACSQVNIDVNQNQEEITFETAFTAYATRTDNSGIGFDEFYVWGYQTDSKNNTICIFNGTPVTFSEGRWDYDKNYSEDEVKGTRYWIPNCTYRFYAFAPEIDPMITISNTASNQPPQIDIMSWGMLPQNEYMYATYNSSETTSSDGSVVLTFNHVLSKVSMSFTNDIHQYIKATVSNINLKIPQSGSVNINIDNITTSTANSQIYTFKLKPENYYDPEILEVVELLPNNNNTGETSSILLFPNESNFDYEVRFDVTLAVHNDVPETYSNETVTPGTTTITGKLTKKLEIGKAYKFSTILTPEVIKSGTTDIYAEEIEGWNNANGEQQISIASKLGGTVTLAKDVEISEPLDVLDDLTINLNGHSIIHNGEHTLFDVQQKATLTINGNDDNDSSIQSSACIAIANEGSNIYINGGHHVTSSITAYKTTDTGGIISITNGQFESATENSELLKGDINKIILTGGSYYEWDPEGYISFEAPYNGISDYDEESGWYHISGQLNINSIINNNLDTDELKNALEQALQDDRISEINIEKEVSAGDRYTFKDVNSDVTIDFHGKKMTIGGANASTEEKNQGDYWYSFHINGCNVIFVNANIEGGGIQVENGGSLEYSGNFTLNHISTWRYCFAITGNNSQVTLNGGNYSIKSTNGNQFYAFVGAGSTLKIESGTFTTLKAKPFNIAEGGTVIITGGSFIFDPTNWLAEGHTATKSGSYWIVSPISQ